MTVTVALDHGEACGQCKGRCEDEPSATSPLYLKGHACDGCGGTGKRSGEACADCQGRGEVMLTSCPRKMVTGEARLVVRAAHAFRHGVLLVGGGYLDQPDAAMKAIQHVIACEEPHRVRAGLKEG